MMLWQRLGSQQYTQLNRNNQEHMLNQNLAELKTKYLYLVIFLLVNEHFCNICTKHGDGCKWFAKEWKRCDEISI